MQKLLYFIPLALGLFIFSSCRKCKDCSCTQTISQSGMGDITQSVEFNNVCDEDLDAIDGTTTFTQGFAGFEQSVVQSCECK